MNKYIQQFIAAGMFIFAYIPTFFWMWDRWFARDSYYSHGILVPFMAGFLIWQKKGDLVSIKPLRSPWGVVLIVAGLTVHAFASLMRVYFVSGFSMLIVLVGLILFFYGSRIFSKILFPVFFLVFMVPFPLVIITDISFKMKIFAAKIAATFLNDFGIPAVRDGSLIRMQHAQVLVDDVCSGLRSLISLMALGSIFAFWMRASMVKRCILFLTTIPIAIITNVVRIVFLSSIAEIWGPQYADGALHTVSGFLVFGVAFILLFIMGRILE